LVSLREFISRPLKMGSLLVGVGDDLGEAVDAADELLARLLARAAVISVCIRRGARAQQTGFWGKSGSTALGRGCRA
jgi:hypothetical protein